MKTTQATGHLDRNDKMIHRHDLVLAARQQLPGIKGKKTETPRPARVLWVSRQWLLRFGDGTTEPMNHYPRHGLEIVGQSRRDNRGTMDGTKLLSRDNEMIVPKIVPKIVPREKR